MAENNEQKVTISKLSLFAYLLQPRSLWLLLIFPIYNRLGQ